LREIQNRADSTGTTIHAIEFGADPVASPDSFLRELATMNHGEYRYVDVRSLGQSSPPSRIDAPNEPVRAVP
jgi:hypothetical protein